ncbi:MAG TPA: alpha/beta hydrolase [Povalibacter sp.]|nr:alpha/beta hydrolase [Povalibacter sp.]
MQQTWIDTRHGRLFAKTWSSEPPDSGDQAPIVLFHDSLGCVELWRDFPERLSQATGRSVVAYDRLGFGRSDPHPGRLNDDFVQAEAREALPAVLDQLGIASFVAFGHSVGGGMAVVCAGEFQSRCRALITVAAQSFVEDRTLNGIRVAQQSFEQAGQLERLRKYHGDKAEWVLSAWIDTWLAPEFAQWNLDADLSRVHCPALIIHGEDDEYGSVQHPKRIASMIRGPATVEILANCAHVPHREKPGAVMNLIGGFLAENA